MDESSHILVKEQTGTLRIAWDNRCVRTDTATSRSFLTCWMICAPLTLLLTGLIFVPDADVLMFFRMPLIICSIVGWLFTMAISYSWITKTWSEWVEISKDSFLIGKTGFLVLKPWRSQIFRLDSIVELAFGSYAGFRSDPRASTTLNVIRHGVLPGNRRKHAFGYWLTPELRLQIFKSIRQFVHNNQIPLKITRYGPQVDTAYPIEVVEHDQKQRLKWDNKRVCKKNDEVWGLVFILTVWTSVTVLVTYYAIFRPDPEIYMVVRVFCAVWCIGGWGFTLFLTHLLAQRFCTEWIEVSEEFFSHRHGGLFLRQPQTLALDSVYEFTISPSHNRREYAYRLKVSYEGPPRRQFRSIGYWMEPDARKQVFEIIEDFVVRKQIPLRMASYGPCFGRQ